MKLFLKRKYEIDKTNLPQCVAFIIDGNGRWAKKRSMPRVYGHRAGIEAVQKTIKNAQKMGLKEIMFYCFSTENWNRPKEEVDGIFELFREFVKDASKYKEENIRFRLCGDRSRIPSDILKKVEEIEQETSHITDMTVCLCVNYGGRLDIVQAVNKIIEDGKKDITEQEFEKYLYTSGISNPDLIIRTSGEKRISNFLLYQMAYSELYFTDTFWPDFNNKELIKAIADYQQRNRRFGTIKE